MPSLLRYRRTAFGVCLDLIGGETLASNQSLYLRASTRTPTLTSSRSFSTLIGADLHPVLPGLHPGQG